VSIDVSFTDASKPGPSGPITAWAWDFGDTGTSSAQNPTHTYAADGRYTVSLTVTGTSPDGTDNITRSVQVTSAAESAPASSLAVTFTDGLQVRFVHFGANHVSEFRHTYGARATP
jgi:PKD repeat protein